MMYKLGAVWNYHRRVFFIFGMVLSFFVCNGSIAKDFNLGVYYFPGWKNNTVGAPSPRPWDKIRPYPNMRPVLGWYPEGSIHVMSQQISWMADHGIDFVVFDMLWGRHGETYLDHAVKAYLSVRDKKNVKFSILWANHTEYIFTKEKLGRIINAWCREYFIKPEYQQLDGKPLVFIFSAKVLNNNIKKIGMTPTDFFNYANQIAKKHGLKGISFVGGTGAADPAIDYSAKSGYAGFSAYNYHSPATFRLSSKNMSNMSHSYSELDRSYQDHWLWLLKNASGTIILPMTSGWNKKPWGGSSDPLHDNSVSTPATFEKHLNAAKAMMQAFPDKTQKTAVICCWNEYGEGSYIEPTKQYGLSYLEKIRTVFSSE